MLSEGEMVVPADVVRYFGVEFFMKLRDEAKMGFKKMEAMGQFGTDEGQTLPDDTLFNAGGPPFTIEDIEVVEPDDVEEEALEANVGAFVQGGQEANPFDQTFGPATNTTLANAGKDPKGFLQSLGTQAFDPNDIINAIGSVNMDYLTALSPAGTNFGENKSSTRKFIDNYFTNFSKNISAAVQPPTTVEEELEVESEDQDVGPTAGQGIGSMSELASAPTAANIGAAKGFSELSSTTIGIMDDLISGALNPFGRSAFGPPGMIGKIGGTLSSMFSSGLSVGLPFGIGPQISLTDPIGTGKGNIDKVATRDQVVAQAIVTTANQTPQVDLDLMSIVGIAEQVGIDIDDIVNNPTVDLVSIENDPLGIGIGTKDRGRFGATRNALGEVTWGSKTSKVSKTDIEKAKALQRDFLQEIKARARGRDQLGAAGITDEVEDEDDIADIDHPDFDQSATTAPDYSDPDDDDAAADAEAAGVGGTDNDADGDDTGVARGGLIKRKPRSKKRGGRKKNKRGGLGSRK